MKIELDIKKNIEQNAEVYFNQQKKLRKKLGGAIAALEVSKKKNQKLEKQRKIEEKQTKTIKKSLKKKWYDKFRWFISSDGFMVLLGRDATTNEILIKKYTERNDLVLHTDIVGSPFVVIKSDNKEIPKRTIKEAADAAVTFGKAWKLGISSTPTFKAKPEQLTKEAPSGEFVPKGGFITKGKLEYIENKINLAVGIKDNRIMVGPLEAIKKNCSKYVEVKQGREKTSRIAKQIQYKLGGDLDEIIRALPAGGCEIKK